MRDTVVVAVVAVFVTCYAFHVYEDGLAIAGLSAAGGSALAAFPCQKKHVLSCAAMYATTQGTFFLTALRTDEVIVVLTFPGYIVCSVCASRALATPLQTRERIRGAPHDVLECAICLEELQADVLALPCAHPFHTDCINRWMQESRTCPLCMYAV
jgi:hypothetical protein